MKQQSQPTRLEIYTLGYFRVCQGKNVISENLRRSYRLWDLFKFFLAHRGQVIPADVILETLWPDQEFESGKSALRSMVYRLRGIFNGVPGGNGLGDLIKSEQGTYLWNADMDCWVDADELERLFHQARSLVKSEPEQAAERYTKALTLYKGQYLPESVYNQWVVAKRVHYHQMFINCIIELNNLLEKQGNREEIVANCEKALVLDFYEEAIHIQLLETLIKMRKMRKARTHYEYVTSFFYKEIGIKPSPALREIYSRMQEDDEGVEADLSFIQEELKDKEIKGAFFCTPADFRSIYTLQSRRGERDGQTVFMGLITLTEVESRHLDTDVLEKAMEKLQEVLVGTLRKGDAVTRWNRKQYLILLPGLNDEQAEKVLQRVKGRYEGKKPENISFRYRIQSLLPPELLNGK